MKFLFLGVILLFVIISFCFVHNIEQSQIITPLEIKASGNCLATDLDIAEYINEQIIFFLHTSCIKIAKKKKGFLRFGFWKVGEFKNLSLTFYQYTDKSCRANQLDEVKNRKFYNKKLELESPKAILNHKKLISILPKGIKGFKADNVTLNILRDNITIFALKSDRAKTGFPGNRIVFKGNVKLVLENGSILKCKRIQFLFKAKKFKTDGAFTLTTHNGIIKGKGFETDVTL